MTDIDKAYGEMQRLALLLLSKLGGDITITERELADVGLAGKAIQVSNPDPARGDARVRIVDEVREGIASKDSWPDVWSEYRSIFGRLKLTEDEARDLITSALHAARVLGVRTDADTLADALKEFVVLCRERRGEGADLPSELAAAVITLSAVANDDDEQRATAVRLFGTPGEQLHRVLAELRWRILDRG